MSTEPRRTVDAPTVNESPFPGVTSDDPTATKTLRNRYGAAMYRRFQALKSAIITGVVERDAFGIADLSPEDRAGPRTPAGFEAAQDRRGGAGAGINIEPPRHGEFAFPSDARKVEGFMAWLAEQVDRGILEADPTGRTRDGGAAEAWQNTYLRQAYSAGVTHADAYLVDMGVIPDEQTLDNAFRAVKHADSAGLIYTRAYNELDGVTSAMAQDMSRVLAEGLTQGHNPRRIARALNDRVENVGIHRGRLIARTETIRAHNEGALNRYEDMDARLGGVTTLAEHMTAGDERVCSECAALSGTVYTIREARGRIPVHPNCRCTWVPVDPRDVSPERGGTATTTERVAEFFDATSDLEPDEQVVRVSEWLSENTSFGEPGDLGVVNLAGLEPERARAISNVMAKMEDGGFLDDVRTLDRHPQFPASVRVRALGFEDAPAAMAQGPQVTFNSDLYQHNELARMVDRGWLTGRFYEDRFEPLEAAVVHEFGHVYHLNNVYDDKRQFQRFMTGRFYGSPREDSIAGRIGRYAATQPAEFVAETFVRLAYDMPVGDELMELYRTFGGPDPERYRGFMLTDGVTGNMADETQPRANAEDVDYPEDLPDTLRAEAEATMDAFREIYRERYGEDSEL